MCLVFFACAVRILVPTPGHTNAYDLPQGLSLLLFGFEAVPWLCAGGSARGDGPGRGGVCGRRAGGHAGPPHQRRRPASGPSPSDKPTNTFDSECVCRQTTNHATSRQGKEWRGGCGSHSHCFGGSQFFDSSVLVIPWEAPIRWGPLSPGQWVHDPPTPRSRSRHPAPGAPLFTPMTTHPLPLYEA